MKNLQHRSKKVIGLEIKSQPILFYKKRLTSCFFDVFCFNPTRLLFRTSLAGKQKN